jgi:hypothetical protein
VVVRHVLVTSSGSTAVDLGGDGVDDSLNLGQSLLVVLGRGGRSVLLDPGDLVLDLGEDGLLVGLVDLHMKSMQGKRKSKHAEEGGEEDGEQERTLDPRPSLSLS